MAWSLCHRGAAKAARWLKFKEIEKDLLDKANYFGSESWNAFYRLVRSSRRSFYFPASQLLVKTKNQMRPELESAPSWQQIADRAQSLYQNCRIPYIKIDWNKPVDLKEGVCQGSVTLFIHDFHQARAKGLPFQEAAIKAAKTFQEGAPLLACALQHAYERSGVDETEFDNAFSKNQFPPNDRQFLLYTARNFCGHLVHGAKKVFNATIDFLHSDLESLPDGTYDITVGTRAILNEGRITLNRHEGHAIALLIEKKNYLIFDPDFGLIKHPDPILHFEAIDSGFPGAGQNFLIYNSVEY